MTGKDLYEIYAKRCHDKGDCIQPAFNELDEIDIDGWAHLAELFTTMADRLQNFNMSKDLMKAIAAKD